MTSTTSHSLRYSLALAAVAGLVMACADGAPAGPNGRGMNAPASDLTAAEIQAASDGRLPDLAGCTQLRVDNSKVSFRVFGIGVQIYRWDGSQWVFSNPEANLYADAGANGLVGTHFSEPGAKPNWLTASGSRVIGTVVDKCTPNANAIAWVKLSADNSGTGVFNQTTFIQRLNTVGGLAPTTPGAFVGQLARSPYTADYYFYRPL